MVQVANVIAQFGAWIWNGIVGAAQAVASAVQAAGEALEQMVDWVFEWVLSMLRTAFSPLLSPLLGPLIDNARDLVSALGLGSSSAPGEVSALSAQAPDPLLDERMKKTEAFLVAGMVFAGAVLVIGAFIALLLDSNPLAAGVIGAAFTIIVFTILVSPLAPEIEAGGQLAGEAFVRLGGLTWSSLQSLGSVLTKFTLDFGNQVNGNIVLIDAVAAWVTKFTLVAIPAAHATGPLKPIVVPAIGWAIALAALVMDGVLGAYPSDAGASVALTLASLSLLVAGYGMLEAVTTPIYPFNVAGAFLSALLAVFAYAGIAASIAHLLKA